MEAYKAFLAAKAYHALGLGLAVVVQNVLCAASLKGGEGGKHIRRRFI